ncbi:class I SAM-dependent methyltransferase [Streptomyces sp. YIM 98790]|uniref:class I SAM-dependent methyltransferase n=1 Tax=Streptomyces sp. YIM 98790 TaxID=2689077 RepID=UPI00140B4697|nr:class I SAM-dependent methyltransferase [Streptomyces sp. YIM 98790]
MSADVMSDNLEERVFGAAVGTLELFGIYLGSRLGLYEVLDERRRTGRGPVTYGEFAAEAGIHPRYAREWLEQQAVADMLAVDDPAADAEARRYHLPAAHAGVLVDQEAADHLAPLARMVVGIAGVLDEVADAYRTGGGVPYARYGEDFRHGQGGINRPAFTTALVEEWLPAAEDVTERLRTSGGRVADLGCGHGWAAIALASAFPRAEVWGLDADPESVEDARANAEARQARVRFVTADASAVAAHGPFDLILVLEALHDMAQPVKALAAARDALAEGGSVIVADEAVAERFTAPGGDLERMMYGWSISACLPSVMAEGPGHAIGTVIREDTVRELAAEAGFGAVEVLPVDAGFFRLYRMTR